MFLVLAIALAVAVAYYNSLIPLSLGKLANALNSLATTAGATHNFMDTLRTPALRLLSCYALQVCEI